MLLRPSLRLIRTSRSRFRSLLLILLGIFFLDSLLIASHNPAPVRVSPSSDNPQQKIFIASIHRNNEYILRLHLNEALLNLTQHYGASNVYFSTYESGSIDDTKGALADLDMKLEKLGVRRSVVLDHSDQMEEVSREPEGEEEGWVMTSLGKIMLRRIPYLARLRNRVMEKLLDEAKEGRKYDIVLWLNDVVFKTEDIVTLIATRSGKYDAVCSMDYSVPYYYYDTFALRDSLGQKAIQLSWPYFQSRDSLQALINNQPVPVKSCWNGVVAFKAAPFYGGSASIDEPLRFRGVPDSLSKYHVEGSECCLIHGDNSLLAGSHGVWLNPNVRVGYGIDVYEAINPKNGRWPGRLSKVWGMWANRTWRLLFWLKRYTEDWVIQQRTGEWMKHENELGNGTVKDPVTFCLINEQQVLYDAGWKHV